ncbi:hypothetical protein C7S20_04450 [Christiangramia fulva]|uniref:DUF3500 domain-containing protein n=1 Tax=Christiangramia fulva TaxID=2126553 RepID=A0A2R3Z2T8_9FLAO|nr:DUF3500 domain-containing protein [Christiangramia fulva]AVR44574.1 hypothetical protein C7S20_04450 [Christiangramia fulva]
MKNIMTLFLAGILISGTCFCQSVDSIITEADQFLNSLSEKQQAIINADFEDSLRTKWTNLPVGMAPRPGLRYGELSEESRIKYHHLLSNILSSQGYLKVTSIMTLDDILNEIYDTAHRKKEIDDKTYQEIRDLNWGYENYFVSFWGEPNITETWGMKLEGHHISLNLTATGNEFSLTPMFLGTDPAEVHTTKFAGLRILNKEEDYGFHLINSLTKDQKSMATLSEEVPADIITNPNFKGRLTEYKGIKSGQMNPKQKQLLKFIIEEYINNLEHEKAAEYLSKIEKSGIDNVYFAWIGSYQHQKPHYYIINGPDFIIEYDNVGFQKNGNHIHTIWREKGNDFGEDILRNHYVLDHKK